MTNTVEGLLPGIPEAANRGDPDTPPAPHPTPTGADAATQLRVSAVYGRLPLQFEANRGQTDSQVRFLFRGARHTVFLTPVEAIVVMTRPPAAGDGGPEQGERLAATVLRMALLGANRQSRVVGQEELPGKANYFIGKDPAKWRTNVPMYAKVHYQDLYPGIDLVYYGNQGQLEYDLVVGPGADPRSIVLGFQGADRLEVDAQGDLVLHTAAGAIHQRRPLIYQEVDGRRREISGGYVLNGLHRVGFQVAAYDRSRPLVIDPVLVYSTYLGGSGSESGGTINPVVIAVDATGHAYVTGSTASVNFPTTAGAFQPFFGGGTSDAFVTKLNPTGTGLVYSTYLGGSDFYDEGKGITVDATGHAYVTGLTTSSTFPTTAGAYQTSFIGGTCPQTPCPDAFVTKLNPTGSALVYSTYLGGSGEDAGFAIAVDGAGNAYVTGQTQSLNFPVTQGAFQPNGVNLTGTTFGPQDVFVTKLNPSGSGLVYSTYLGGHLGETAVGIAVDSGGSASVAGLTQSTDFPTTSGAFQPTFGGGGDDAFVTKLNASGTGLVYSTFLGGSSRDGVNGPGLALDAAGHAYLTGFTQSSDFPLTGGAFQTSFAGIGDAFVTKLNSTGTGLVSSTYLGGSGGNEFGNGIALDAGPAPNTYVAGVTDSTNFLTTPGAFQPTFGGGSTDAFVAKIATIIEVQIDIKPGSFPNSINLSSAGAVPVAILSSGTFDATTVDPASVALAGAAVKLIGKGDKYSCSAEDVNSDGLTDLVCHVVTAQFMIEPGDSIAVLEAQTFSGQRIRGEDSIRIVPD